MKEFIEKLIEKIVNTPTKCLDTYSISSPDIITGVKNGIEYGCASRQNEIIDMIEEFTEEHNNGWISVSDRLPDYFDNVLVCTQSGGRTIAHLKHTPIEWRDMHMNKIDDVIAWEHLDAPYQPKGE